MAEDVYIDIYTDYFGPFPEFIADFYLNLPEVYREYDILDAQDNAFEKYIISLTESAGEIDSLFNRLWFETEEADGPGFVQGILGNCDLANPSLADSKWLTWMAQVLGISLKGLGGNTPGQKVVKQRSWLSDPTEARRVGSRNNLITLGKVALGGTQYLEVLRSTAALGQIGDASEWDVALAYRSDEVVGDPAEVVIAAGGKPAGWLLHSRTVSCTWEVVKNDIGTWGAVKAKGSWAQVYLTGIG